MTLLSNTLGPLYVQANKGLFVQLKNKDDNAPNPFLASLRLARVAGFSETDKSERLSEGDLNIVAGGDAESARVFYSNEIIKVVPRFHLFYATNYLPAIKSSDIYQKVAIWTFPIRFTANGTRPNTAVCFRQSTAGNMQKNSDGVGPPTPSGFEALPVSVKFVLPARMYPAVAQCWTELCFRPRPTFSFNYNEHIMQ